MLGYKVDGGREGWSAAQLLPHFVFLTATMPQTSVKCQGSAVWFFSSELQKDGEVASFIRAQLQHPPGAPKLKEDFIQANTVHSKSQGSRRVCITQ